MAQTLIGRGEQWEEAIEQSEAALARFNQSDDLVGQADTVLALGMARRGNDQLDEALTNLEQALTLYQQQQQPLGEADARYELADVFLERQELARALTEFHRSIALVEEVMKTLSTAQQWSTFLRQYSDLYAQTAITAVRLQQDSQARALLTNYARIAGPEDVVKQIQTYSDTIPTSGADMTATEIEENKNLITRLKQLIKGL